MTNAAQWTRRIRRWSPAAALLVAAAALAGAASPGGGYWTAVGPGKFRVKEKGLKPMEVLGNLRFDFDGIPSDASGACSVDAYDATGLTVIAEFPIAWTAGRGASFRFDCLNEGFEEYLETVLSSTTGKAASVTLEKASGKGALVLGGTDLRASIAASGLCSLDGGELRPLRVKMKVK